MKVFRLAMIACVLIGLAEAVLWVFESLDHAEKASHVQIHAASPASPDSVDEQDPHTLTLQWLKAGAQGDPAPFWDQLIFIAESPDSALLARKRAKSVLLNHSKPQLHAMILNAMAEIEAYNVELQRERDVYTRKRREIDRDIRELKLRYPLADTPQNPDIYGPDEMKELVSYALSYKRDRMILDGALARLSEVLQADVDRIHMDQNVFRSRLAQLQKIMDKPGYLPVADVKTWSPELLSIRERLHTLITFESQNLRLDQLLAHITQLSGVPIELDPQVSEFKSMRINLAITEMDASLAANWTARLVELDAIEVEGRILFVKPDPKRREPRAAQKPRADSTRLENPSIPNESPGDF